MIRPVSTMIAMLALCVTTAAHAEPTKEECLDNNAKAQSLRNAGKMRAARDALLVCGNAACPQMVRDDCQQRMDELQRTLPTIVFEGKDGEGHDLLAVKVSMDGQVLADKLDGTALIVDLGDHEFTFEVAGQPPVKQHFVIREGDKARHERVVIASSTKPAVVEPAQTTKPTESHDAAPLTQQPAHDEGVANRGTGQRIAGISILSVGIAGGVVAAIFGGLWVGRHNDFSTTCPTASTPGCIKGQESTAVTGILSDESTFSTVSAVTGVVGGVAIITGIIVFATAPKGAASSALRLMPTIGLHEMGLSLSGAF